MNMLRQSWQRAWFLVLLRITKFLSEQNFVLTAKKCMSVTLHCKISPFLKKTTVYQMTTIVNQNTPQVHLILTFSQFQIISNYYLKCLKQKSKKRKVRKHCFVNHCSCFIFCILGEKATTADTDPSWKIGQHPCIRSATSVTFRSSNLD